MRKTAALVTSGLGTAYGGIGVVAESMSRALAPCKVLIWQHPAFWPRMARISKLGAQMCLGSLNPPDVLIYDHVHLAVLHGTIPYLRRIPYVVMLHGIEVWEPLTGRRREALLGASLLIANSGFTVVAARKVNPWLPRVKVTWLGVRGQVDRVDPGKSPPVGLIVGRMASSERYKGHDAVMNAWPLVRAAVPDAKLLIVGTGSDEPRLRRRVTEEKLQAIEFVGRLSDAERDRTYRSARLVLYPSNQEGFGLAGVEALAFGVPFVGLAGSVVEELFPNHEGVTVARDLGRESIAEAAIPIFKYPELASKLGSIGHSRVQSTFLEKHFIARFQMALAPILPGLRFQNNEPELQGLGAKISRDRQPAPASETPDLGDSAS